MKYDEDRTENPGFDDGPILQAIKQNFEALNSLRTQISRLEMKIGPILGPSGTVKAMSGDNVQPLSSTVQADLRSQFETIHSMIDAVSGLVESVEL